MMGTPGQSDNMLEMAAEIHDPALWAALQLMKETNPPPKTQGECIDIIRRVFDQAMDMKRNQEKAAQVGGKAP